MKGLSVRVLKETSLTEYSRVFRSESGSEAEAPEAALFSGGSESGCGNKEIN